MKKKTVSIAILLMIIAISVVIGILGIERKLTQKSLQAKQVAAQETKDTTPPVIILKGQKELTIKQGKYQELGYTAVDDKDGSVVGKVKITKQQINDKDYKLIYAVTDNAGNIGKAERIIHVEIPEISENQNDTDSNLEKKEEENKTQVENKNDNKNTNNTKKEDNKNTKSTSQENISKEKGIIYLTFDDGPTNSSTPKILDILKKHHVKATFFLLNYNSSTEVLVKREVAEGHSVGIHGYSHDYKKIYASEAAYIENLNKLQNKIYKSTGLKTTITRFPGGSSNTISKFNPGIMTKLSKSVVENGYTYYDWNVDSSDAGGAKNADEVYKNVTKNLSKKGRNIILMHDFSGNKKTIEALEKIIIYGKNNGYTFEKITPNTRMMRHGINN